jgi:hypothetical protein
MADLPDGLDYNSLRCAIAWEITKLALANSQTFRMASAEDRLKMLTETYNNALRTVINAPSEEKKQGTSHQG